MTMINAIESESIFTFMIQFSKKQCETCGCWLFKKGGQTVQFSDFEREINCLLLLSALRVFLFDVLRWCGAELFLKTLSEMFKIIKAGAIGSHTDRVFAGF